MVSNMFHSQSNIWHMGDKIASSFMYIHTKSSDIIPTQPYPDYRLLERFNNISVSH
jgi:hypothetical protein